MPYNWFCAVYPTRHTALPSTHISTYIHVGNHELMYNTHDLCFQTIAGATSIRLSARSLQAENLWRSYPRCFLLAPCTRGRLLR